MNVTADQTAKKTPSSSPGEQGKKHKSKYAVHSPTRETVESIVVAFILAFMFRTFEAEPFVIPTGSMAETLNGRHKEVDCEQCGWHYNIGASREVAGDSGVVNPHERIRSSVCPNCRFVNDVWDLPVFQGDRIIVNKFPYEFGDPERWDVIVFKNPEEPMRNFIKRLVGMPNEYLRIEGGDVYARKDETAEWKILRKTDPNKQYKLQMNVYDNDHPEKKLIENGWPERWIAATSNDPFESDPSGWKQQPDSRSFLLETASSEPKWLRYRHYVPDEDDWNAIFQDPPLPFDGNPKPQLINDFCGYNEIVTIHKADPAYWVGDLTVHFEIDVRDVGEQSELVIVLTEGIRDYHCKIDFQSGTASLGFYHRGFKREELIAMGNTSIRGAGSYSLAFANVDNRLCLWIDDTLVPFENQIVGFRGGEYAAPTAPSTVVPTRNDLAPVGISLEGAVAQVSKLKLERDIYYRPEQERWMEQARVKNGEFERSNSVSRRDLLFALDEPERYAELYRNHKNWVEFPPLKEGEYFVLGDNSPASLDSRLWDHTHAVPRHDLLGKAFFIYWPHGVPFMNGGQGYPITSHTQSGHGDQEDYPKLRFPFYPNFKRMERIR